MMNWLPWRYIVRRIAQSHGFLDPIALLAKLHQFAQPSEVGEPIELLRAGVVFHARGLINSRTIQHNLDWVWPFWIERQFDPNDEAFVPRAFSITHVNLTHRNWTAIGYPDFAELPIVDPRGLLTPFLDGWSLDSWVLANNGRCLLPSRTKQCRQILNTLQDISVTTETRLEDLALTSTAAVQLEAGLPVCKLTLKATANSAAWLVLALRPQNPEGVSLVQEVSLAKTRNAWHVDNKHHVIFSDKAERHHTSDYRNGDVYIHLKELGDQQHGKCNVGMVTAAALFPIAPGQMTEITVSIPLAQSLSTPLKENAWGSERQQCCTLKCPEPRYQFLFDAAITSLILHSPGDVYPGPYTYKRFWFRDAAFIINAMLCAGLSKRAERALENFLPRQTATGYFRSQEGEWDANGEVLWIVERFFALTGRPLSPHWYKPLQRAARWIIRKRLSDALDAPHAGLLPAGFSAEHLGPNDYYYWDDFWGIAGLKAAATLIKDHDENAGKAFSQAAEDFSFAVNRSLKECEQRIHRPAMPASPYRRLDAGVIGSLVIGYPLHLCAPDDPRLIDSVNFLLRHCFVKHAFFQDMIHSGLNAYLTLHVAQVLLRAGDARYLELMDAVVALASPTGQWPEAIHPRTGGGCMGDGHHVWASAEWVLMIRHCFVREEGSRLVLCAGIPQRWLEQEEPIIFGPTLTTFGSISVTLTPIVTMEAYGNCRIEWQGRWHKSAPTIDIRLPGFNATKVTPEATSVTLSKKTNPEPNVWLGE